jgi:hypothetical protein
LAFGRLSFAGPFLFQSTFMQCYRKNGPAISLVGTRSESFLL